MDFESSSNIRDIRSNPKFKRDDSKLRVVTSRPGNVVPFSQKPRTRSTFDPHLEQDLQDMAEDGGGISDSFYRPMLDRVRRGNVRDIHSHPRFKRDDSKLRLVTSRPGNVVPFPQKTKSLSNASRLLESIIKAENDSSFFETGPGGQGTPAKPLKPKPVRSREKTKSIRPSRPLTKSEFIYHQNRFWRYFPPVAPPSDGIVAKSGRVTPIPTIYEFISTMQKSYGLSATQSLRNLSSKMEPLSKAGGLFPDFNNRVQHFQHLGTAAGAQHLDMHVKQLGLTKDNPASSTHQGLVKLPQIGANKKPQDHVGFHEAIANLQAMNQAGLSDTYNHQGGKLTWESPAHEQEWKDFHGVDNSNQSHVVKLRDGTPVIRMKHPGTGQIMTFGFDRDMNGGTGSWKPIAGIRGRVQKDNDGKYRQYSHSLDADHNEHIEHMTNMLNTYVGHGDKFTADNTLHANFARAKTREALHEGMGGDLERHDAYDPRGRAALNNAGDNFGSTMDEHHAKNPGQEPDKGSMHKLDFSDENVQHNALNKIVHDDENHDGTDANSYKDTLHQKLDEAFEKWLNDPQSSQQGVKLTNPTQIREAHERFQKDLASGKIKDIKGLKDVDDAITSMKYDIDTDHPGARNDIRKKYGDAIASWANQSQEHHGHDWLVNQHIDSLKNEFGNTGTQNPHYDDWVDPATGNFTDEAENAFRRIAEQKSDHNNSYTATGSYQIVSSHKHAELLHKLSEHLAKVNPNKYGAATSAFEQANNIFHNPKALKKFESKYGNDPDVNEIINKIKDIDEFKKNGSYDKGEHASNNHYRDINKFTSDEFQNYTPSLSRGHATFVNPNTTSIDPNEEIGQGNRNAPVTGSDAMKHFSDSYGQSQGLNPQQQQEYEGEIHKQFADLSKTHNGQESSTDAKIIKKNKHIIGDIFFKAVNNNQSLPEILQSSEGQQLKQHNPRLFRILEKIHENAKNSVTKSMQYFKHQQEELAKFMNKLYGYGVNQSLMSIRKAFQ